MVVEPMSIATPKARSAKPGKTATMSRPLRTATVTFQPPARSVFCRAASVARSAPSVVDAPLLGERLLQAAEVARRLVHVRLADLDVMQAHHRIDFDRMLFGALAHDLAMDLALGRHVDDEIAADLRLAAEPPSRRQRAALVGVALLDRVPGRRVSRRATRSRAWRTAPRRPRSGSARRCRVRRRPNRGRRRATAPRRAGSSLRRNRRACPTA